MKKTLKYKKQQNKINIILQIQITLNKMENK